MANIEFSSVEKMYDDIIKNLFHPNYFFYLQFIYIVLVKLVNLNILWELLQVLI